MRKRSSVIAELERRKARVLLELHPALRDKVVLLLADLGGRLTPYCGYRGMQEQAAAKAAGHSHARFGQSPHNFAPALACDLVLHPSWVPVRERADAAGYPDLWDVETPDALAAWEALERGAQALGLERVTVFGVRDRPHVQLPDWRSLIPH